MFQAANRASLMRIYLKITSSKDDFSPTWWHSWNRMLWKSSSQHVLDVWTTDEVSKGIPRLKKIDTRQVRIGRQWNPAAFTRLAELQRWPKNFHWVPFPNLLHGCQNTHVPPISLRRWGQTHHERHRVAPTQQSQPPTQAHPSLSFFALAGQSINTNVTAVGLIHMKSVAVPHLFTWLQKQHAMRVDSTNRWCAANADKRENKGRKSGTYSAQNEWHGPFKDRTSVVEKTRCLSGQRTDSQSRHVS